MLKSKDGDLLLQRLFTTMRVESLGLTHPGDKPTVYVSPEFWDLAQHSLWVDRSRCTSGVVGSVLGCDFRLQPDLAEEVFQVGSRIARILASPV